MVGAMPASSPARRWIFFGLAGLCLLMHSIDMTIVSVALLTIVEDFDTSLSLAAWTITGYALVQLVMLPLIGKLGERFGQMRVFLACVLVFTLGSLMSGLAPTIFVLILFRMLQATGGAGFMTSATAIVAREFPETRSRMIGLFASILPLGGIVGPNVGGYIIQHYGWRLVFLVNVPIGVLTVLLLVWLSRANGLLKAPVNASRRPLDFHGSGLFAGAIVSILLALTFLGDDPGFIWTPLFWALFGAGLVLLTPRSLAMIVVSACTSIFIIKLGYRVPIVLGMVGMIVSMLIIGQGWDGIALGGLELGPFVLLSVTVGLSGAAMGLFMPSANNAALDLMPDRVGVVSGLRQFFRQVGGMIGTAGIVVALSLSTDKAAGMREIYTVLGIMLLLTIPLAFLIPDAARERRQRAATATKPTVARSERATA